MAPILRLRLGLLLLLGVLLLGTAGYTLIERWPLFDALYMSAVTLSTVGFGEIHPLSRTGRMFTLGFILLGRVAELYFAIVFAEAVVVDPLRDALGRRRMERDLAHLHDHYIVCGWGRMGQEIVRHIRAKGARCVVIESNEEKCRRLAEHGIPFVHGDASSDPALTAAGVQRARGLISVAPRDADNIFITLSARALNRTLFIVARSIYEADVHKLEIAGADRVISPYVIGARRIAAAVLHPTVVDFLDLEVHHEELEWELDELLIAGDSGFAGRTLGESEIRRHSGCTVLAVKSAATGRFTSDPDPDFALCAGDTLVVLGTAEQLQRLEALAGDHPHVSRAKRP